MGKKEEDRVKQSRRRGTQRNMKKSDKALTTPFHSVSPYVESEDSYFWVSGISWICCQGVIDSVNVVSKGDGVVWGWVGGDDGEETRMRWRWWLVRAVLAWLGLGCQWCLSVVASEWLRWVHFRLRSWSGVTGQQTLVVLIFFICFLTVHFSCESHITHYHRMGFSRP